MPARSNLDWWNGRQVWVGFDLSQTDDNTAVAMVTEEDNIIYARVMGFFPGDKVEIKSIKEKVDYKRAEAAGECTACGDEVIDYSVVEKYILNLEENYGVEVQQIGYDRWNAISTVQKLEAAGMTCVEIKQHSSVLHMPTKLLKRQFWDRRLDMTPIVCWRLISRMHDVQRIPILINMSTRKNQQEK